MEQTWRGFGRSERVTLRDARETSATGIATALYEVPMEEVWPVEQIYPLPFRADHQRILLNDRERAAAPGYPAVGRLSGAFVVAERLLMKMD